MLGLRPNLNRFDGWPIMQRFIKWKILFGVCLIIIFVMLFGSLKCVNFVYLVYVIMV